MPVGYIRWCPGLFRGSSACRHHPVMRPGVPSHRQTRISSPVAVSSRLARTLAFPSTTAETRAHSAARAETDGSSCRTRSRSWSAGKYGTVARTGSVWCASSWFRRVSSAIWASSLTRLLWMFRAVSRFFHSQLPRMPITVSAVHSLAQGRAVKRTT